MSAGGIALAVVLGGGGIALLLRARAKQLTPTQSACKALSEKTGLPAGVCEAGAGLLGAIGDLFSGTDWKAREDENTRINGTVKVKLHRLLADRNISGVFPTGYRWLEGNVAEYANGCRPFEGAVGWAMCGEGTKSMLRGSLLSSTTDYNGKKYATGPGHIGTGREGDPLTQGPFTPGKTTVGITGASDTSSGKPHKMTAAEFPLPLPTGKHGWFWRGRPTVCGPEGPNTRLRDHREGHEDDVPPCGSNEPIKPPPAANHDPDDAPGAPPPGFTGGWR